MTAKKFLKNVAGGALIGIAAIIPGVSGGTVAVLMNIYDELVGAISDLGKAFKKNFLFILPILVGVALGIGIMYFPLKFALERAPLPTVLLFTGLMLGSFPKLLKDGIALGFKKLNIASLVIPCAAVIAICFIPAVGTSANLGADMPVWGYFVLVVMGVVASAALVIPGVSGSLVLLIFGYYAPIIETLGALVTDFGHSVLVLLLFAVGLVAGFFLISKLMKLFLNKFPRGTHWAIIGFVIGSIPAIFITFADNFPEAAYDGVQIAAGAILCIGGILLTYFLTSYADAVQKRNAKANDEKRNNTL